MGRPDRGPTGCDADFLRNLVAHAYGAGNQALDELAQERHAEKLCPTQAQFRYADPASGDGGARVIPIAQFHRQYGLCLDALELIIYGYCVYKEFGWERIPEPVFCLRRPPVWRRVVTAAPLLAFTVSAQQDQVTVAIGAADRPGYKNKRNHFIRLGRELQEQLIRIHSEQAAARSLKNRVISLLRRLRRN